MSGLPTVTDTGRAHVRRQRVEIAVGLVALMVGVARFFALASAFACFGVAVAAAFAWCFWLERHPEDVHGFVKRSTRGSPNVKAVLRLRTPRGVASWYFHPW